MHSLNRFSLCTIMAAMVVAKLLCCDIICKRSIVFRLLLMNVRRAQMRLMCFHNNNICSLKIMGGGGGGSRPTYNCHKIMGGGAGAPPPPPPPPSFFIQPPSFPHPLSLMWLQWNARNVKMLSTTTLLARSLLCSANVQPMLSPA